MRPIIGIVVSLNKERESYVGGRAYVEAIEAAGGLPLLLPCTDDEDMASQLFTRVDGLLLPGGPGFEVAGKTGTAQKAVPGQGYVDGKYTSLFSGFFPVDEPKYLALVVLDEVKTTPVWAMPPPDSC